MVKWRQWQYIFVNAIIKMMTMTKIHQTTCDSDTDSRPQPIDEQAETGRQTDRQSESQPTTNDYSQMTIQQKQQHSFKDIKRKDVTEIHNLPINTT